MVTRQTHSSQDGTNPTNFTAPAPDSTTKSIPSLDSHPRTTSLLEQQLRQQLARDLHDGPVQTLSYLTLQLMVLQQQLVTDPGGVHQELAGLISSMHGAVKQMRTIMHELRPLALERDGLISALTELVTQVRERHLFRMCVELAETDIVLPAPIQINVFYIAQEAIQNTIKHAQANTLHVSLSMAAGMLQLFVGDDGEGFDLALLNQDYSTRKSLGMLSMRERAELIGGKLTVFSGIGQGTTIQLNLPL